jgi:hypothetical protein
LAAELLEAVLSDFEEHGINEAVNHDFVYSAPAPTKGPKTYVGTMGYLASAASVYSVIWEPAIAPASQQAFTRVKHDKRFLSINI